MLLLISYWTVSVFWAIVWERLNIELELYVSIYISGACSASRENLIEFTRIISWTVFPSFPNPPLPSIPFKEPISGSPRGPPGPSVPFFLPISCAVRQKRVDIFTHLPCVNVEHGTPAKRAIILICARLWRQQGGSSLEANKAAVIFSVCGGSITVSEKKLYWMFAHRDES